MKIDHKYNYVDPAKRRKHRVILLLVFGFLLVISVLGYTAFFGSGLPFSGMLIMPNYEEDIAFYATLNAPENLELQGEFESVVISGKSDYPLYVGSQKFSLKNVSSNYFIFNNFKGEVFVNDQEISKFKGKTSDAVINGVPISDSSDDFIKTYFDGNFKYSSVEVIEKVFISRVSYNATGRIELEDGKNTFQLSEEKLSFENFVGDIKISGDEIIFDGYIDTLKISGDREIFID
ncbi:hypothetical protein K9L16_00820 [Candidatus Pacearchaeota archaeon]|nr:hypothetical protein [Candidatus Pacearchaeota archaeon]